MKKYINIIVKVENFELNHSYFYIILTGGRPVHNFPFLFFI